VDIFFLSKPVLQGEHLHFTYNFLLCLASAEKSLLFCLIFKSFSARNSTAFCLKSLGFLGKNFSKIRQENAIFVPESQ